TVQSRTTCTTECQTTCHCESAETTTTKDRQLTTGETLQTETTIDYPKFLPVEKKDDDDDGTNCWKLFLSCQLKSKRPETFCTLMYATLLYAVFIALYVCAILLLVNKVYRY
uniref:Uncharacterized protein n=1 Tax=Panagrolaimus sp. JU765 TaxID=591449 RepID=A0AC34RBF8_9BILA